MARVEQQMELVKDKVLFVLSLFTVSGKCYMQFLLNHEQPMHLRLMLLLSRQRRLSSEAISCCSCSPRVAGYRLWRIHLLVPYSGSHSIASR